MVVLDVDGINTELNTINQERIDMENGVQEQTKEFQDEFDRHIDKMAKIYNEKTPYEQGCF